jgi:hypothetical protein
MEMQLCLLVFSMLVKDSQNTELSDAFSLVVEENT